MDHAMTVAILGFVGGLIVIGSGMVAIVDTNGRGWSWLLASFGVLLTVACFLYFLRLLGASLRF